jgi:uncharacterized membrane protein YdjX (TVP38/TMEM64 family)
MDPGKRKTASLVARIILLAAFLGAVLFASLKLGPLITRHMTSPEELEKFIASYGSISALVYILTQAIQVVVFVIPGEIVQIAGGYIFGTWLGVLYSVGGILLGTVISFLAARLVGFRLLKSILPPRKLEEFGFLINNPKAEIAMFVLFLVPGIPKDSLVYIAGLTPVKPLRFFLVSMIARFPGILGSAYIGANLQQKDYLPVWILSGVTLVLFIVGVMTKDRILARLRRLRRGESEAPPEGRA